MLRYHMRVHLNIRSFRCVWPNCQHSSALKPSLIKHIRTQHFKLPPTQKEQAQLNIVDDRNPNDYVEEDEKVIRYKQSHLNIHDESHRFRCAWSDCPFSDRRKRVVARHVRTRHFKLPLSHMEQARHKIVDNRKPHDYVEDMQKIKIKSIRQLK